VDPHGNIYLSTEPSPGARYLRGKVEEAVAAGLGPRAQWYERRRRALGGYRREYEKIAGISAESPSQPVPQPPTPAPQPPPPGA